jgi:hypothetical protein
VLAMVGIIREDYRQFVQFGSDEKWIDDGLFVSYDATVEALFPNKIPVGENTTVRLVRPVFGNEWLRNIRWVFHPISTVGHGGLIDRIIELGRFAFSDSEHGPYKTNTVELYDPHQSTRSGIFYRKAKGIIFQKLGSLIYQWARDGIVEPCPAEGCRKAGDGQKVYLFPDQLMETGMVDGCCPICHDTGLAFTQKIKTFRPEPTQGYGEPPDRITIPFGDFGNGFEKNLLSEEEQKEVMKEAIKSEKARRKNFLEEGAKEIEKAKNAVSDMVARKMR